MHRVNGYLGGINIIMHVPGSTVRLDGDCEAAGYIFRVKHELDFYACILVIKEGFS